MLNNKNIAQLEKNKKIKDREPKVIVNEHVNKKI